MTKKEIKEQAVKSGLQLYARSLYGSNLTEEQIKEKMLTAKALIDKDKK